MPVPLYVNAVEGHRAQMILPQKNVCFFCGEAQGNSGMHEAATFQIDRRVCACAILLEDTELLS